MELPKNIFFYWDSLEIPEEALNNVKNYKAKNEDFNVKILNDEDINIYKNEFPELIELFHLSTIAALKSDIIRLIFLYKEGGIWIDMNTTLNINNGINVLYDRYKQYDFVITINHISRNPIETNTFQSGCLISKINSKLAYDAITKITENLKRHYELEKNSQVYIPYNFFPWVAPMVFLDLLEYNYDYDFRQKINNEFIKDNDNNVITLKSKKFEEYNCGLMDVTHSLCFHNCNMLHHHGRNCHKHWTNLQKIQKLFK